MSNDENQSNDHHYFFEGADNANNRRPIFDMSNEQNHSNGHPYFFEGADNINNMSYNEYQPNPFTDGANTTRMMHAIPTMANYQTQFSQPQLMNNVPSHPITYESDPYFDGLLYDRNFASYEFGPDLSMFGTDQFFSQPQLLGRAHSAGMLYSTSALPSEEHQSNTQALLDGALFMQQSEPNNVMDFTTWAPSTPNLDDQPTKEPLEGVLGINENIDWTPRGG